MYAVFEDGARQYKVSVGQVVKVDYREVELGQRVQFGRVLLYSDAADLRIGQPTVKEMQIVGEVVGHPSTKLYIQHFRRRKNYRRLRGHRQLYTAVRVEHILLPGQPVPPPAPKPVKAATPPAETAPTA